MKLQYIQFLIFLKNSSLLKHNIIFFPFNPRFIILLNFLYKEGLIQSFIIDKNLYCYKIILRDSFDLSTLKLISKSSNSKFINYSNLCLINEKNSFLVISNNLGLFTLFNCKKFKFGGKILFQIN